MSKQDFIPLWLKIISAFTPVLVGAFGAWQVSQTENIKNNLLETVEENKRRSEMSDKMFASIPLITDSEAPKKQGLATLAALYVLAKNDDDKKNLFRFAIISGEEDLRDAASFIIATDKMSDELYSNLNDIMNASVSQQIDNKISDDRNKAIDIAEETGDKAELADIGKKLADIGKKDEPLEITAEVQASAFTTAKKASLGKKTVWGWIYLGKRNKENILQNDKTVKRKNVPPVGEDITTITYVALRDEPTSIKSAVKGVLSKGQEVEVEKIFDKKELKSGGFAVWAKVSVPK